MMSQGEWSQNAQHDGGDDMESAADQDGHHGRTRALTQRAAIRVIAYMRDGDEDV
jgi:hypothetical protein